MVSGGWVVAQCHMVSMYFLLHFFLCVIAEQYSNVALQNAGATCEASSQIYNAVRCSGALDGVTSGGFQKLWHTKLGETNDTWINITFNQMYRLVYARFMSSFRDTDGFKDILLTFSDGTNAQVGESLICV